MSNSPVVALIHATPASMEPAKAAFGDLYSEANLWHLLDDRLDRDAAAAGGLTDDLADRMTRLIQYAVDAGADAVQLACSMFASVATGAQQPVPVFSSDQGMFDEIARLDPGRVLVLASIEPAGADSTSRLSASLAAAGRSPEVETAVITEARAATLTGDLASLVRLLSEPVRAAGRDGAVDVVMLAQYSLSSAAASMSSALGVPVLSGPRLAASRLARALKAPTTTASGVTS